MSAQQEGGRNWSGASASRLYSVQCTVHEAIFLLGNILRLQFGDGASLQFALAPLTLSRSGGEVGRKNAPFSFAAASEEGHSYGMLFFSLLFGSLITSAQHSHSHIGNATKLQLTVRLLSMYKPLLVPLPPPNTQEVAAAVIAPVAQELWWNKVCVCVSSPRNICRYLGDQSFYWFVYFVFIVNPFLLPKRED